jgi:hypothetical protein
MLPSRTAPLNGSNGKTTFISMRMAGLPLFLDFTPSPPKAQLQFRACPTQKGDAPERIPKSFLQPKKKAQSSALNTERPA